MIARQQQRRDRGGARAAAVPAQPRGPGDRDRRQPATRPSRRRRRVALDAFAEREAGPLDLVPTASVAVALALGDALALAVMERKGITPEALRGQPPVGPARPPAHAARPRRHARGRRAPRVGAETPLLERRRRDHRGRPRRGRSWSTTRARWSGSSPTATSGAASQRGDPTTLGAVLRRDVMTADPVVVAPDAMAYDALQLDGGPAVADRRAAGRRGRAAASGSSACTTWCGSASDLVAIVAPASR